MEAACQLSPRLGLQTTLCPRPPISWASRAQTRGLDTNPVTSDLKVRDETAHWKAPPLTITAVCVSVRHEGTKCMGATGL